MSGEPENSWEKTGHGFSVLLINLVLPLKIRVTPSNLPVLSIDEISHYIRASIFVVKVITISRSHPHFMEG